MSHSVATVPSGSIGSTSINIGPVEEQTEQRTSGLPSVRIVSMV
jgi:hypothetical protein